MQSVARIVSIAATMVQSRELDRACNTVLSVPMRTVNARDQKLLQQLLAITGQSAHGPGMSPAAILFAIAFGLAAVLCVTAWYVTLMLHAA
jgi:hypothetical protein